MGIVVFIFITLFCSWDTTSLVYSTMGKSVSFYSFKHCELILILICTPIPPVVQNNGVNCTMASSSRIIINMCHEGAKYVLFLTILICVLECTK